MTKQRTDRLNSLLKEVISEVIHRQVKNPVVSKLTTITRVDITKDLKQAKVFVSVIGTEEQKAKTLAALESASGFIAVNASKKVVIRYFPVLQFVLDDGVDKYMRIEDLLTQIHKEEDCRQSHQNEGDSIEDLSDDDS